MPEARVLGVLGGMGPLASAHFMLRLTLLTPAEHDQDHVPAVLWSDPRVPSRTRGKGGPEDPLPWLNRGIAGLREAGCGAVAIPCNTAHGWYPEMAAEAGLPILHIVSATVADLRRAGVAPGPIGLMGTAATLAMRLYQDRLEAEGWACLTPTPAEMDRLVAPAIALVKANRPGEAWAPFAEAAGTLRARGAGALVLGCTELPLALAAGPAGTLGMTAVDSIDALARAAIAWARGDDAAPAH
ncbi:MAG: aspartate/glutamate racemase family protein [Rhodospirillales bacterium]|nr:aspartate/glutamate racemase family protein [Rhodospirillales bacterium]